MGFFPLVFVPVQNFTISFFCLYFWFHDHSIILFIFSVSMWVVHMTGDINDCWHSIISKNSLILISIRSTSQQLLKAFGNNVCLADQEVYLLSHVSYISSLTSGFCLDVAGTWRKSHGAASASLFSWGLCTVWWCRPPASLFFPSLPPVRGVCLPVGGGERKAD